jgi:putative addiction module component (TIGR02574 family)
MTEAARTLSVQARKLSPSERLELMDDILASLFEGNEIESAWATEVERRIEEIESGWGKLVPAAEAVARARAGVESGPRSP